MNVNDFCCGYVDTNDDDDDGGGGGGDNWVCLPP
jgi:hypothetical protein